MATEDIDVEQLRTQVETLQQAVVSNRVVAMAMGLEMARLGIIADEAFAALRRRSQNSNASLHTIADQIVEAHNTTNVGGTDASPLADVGCVVTVR